MSGNETSGAAEATEALVYDALAGHVGEGPGAAAR